MKKGNLFLTLVFVALAVLVGVGSMFATFAQAQNVALQVAAAEEERKGTVLFDNNGNYAVERTSLTKGAKYNFFGYDWYLVNLNEDAEVATFWMVEPYGSNEEGAKPDDYRYAFNGPIKSAKTDTEIFWDGKTLWSNGYSDSVWVYNDNLHLYESKLKAKMREIAQQLIDNPKYKNYKSKVVAGYVAGSNMDNKNAKLALTNVYHAEEGITSLYRITSPQQSMTAYYSLDGTDRLWVPATEEVHDNGFWRLSNTERNFSDRTIDNVVWLRTAVDDHSGMAQLVGCGTTIHDSETGIEATQEQSFYKHYVDQKHGVRPAVHLSLKNYGDGNGNNGGWFTDDMMKVFFIIICVLGVIGVILVIVAVVAKARRDKNADGQQNA